MDSKTGEENIDKIRTRERFYQSLLEFIEVPALSSAVSQAGLSSAWLIWAFVLEHARAHTHNSISPVS